MSTKFRAAAHDILVGSAALPGARTLKIWERSQYLPTKPGRQESTTSVVETSRGQCFVYFGLVSQGSPACSLSCQADKLISQVFLLHVDICL